MVWSSIGFLFAVLLSKLLGLTFATTLLALQLLETAYALTVSSLTRAPALLARLMEGKIIASGI